MFHGLRQRRQQGPRLLERIDERLWRNIARSTPGRLVIVCTGISCLDLRAFIQRRGSGPFISGSIRSRITRPIFSKCSDAAASEARGAVEVFAIDQQDCCRNYCLR